MGRTKQHKLLDMIILTICGIICGAETWVEIEEFGKAKQEWFKRLLELPNGIPSHDTFGRVFKQINLEIFEDCFFNWSSTLNRAISQEIPINSKTLCQSHESTIGKKPLPVVSAWAAENRRALEQLAGKEKDNKTTTAIPNLLYLLHTRGYIVNIHAPKSIDNINKQSMKKILTVV
jgi:hypothetical protein